MRILLTRPEADAQRTAATLRALGHEVIIAPLLDLELLPDADLGAGPWAALLVTSANAVRAIASHRRRDELRGVAVFTVGDRTAQAMRDAGFASVTSAGGNVNDLANLVAARISPPARLLYLAGEERSGDLAGLLRGRNFTVHTALVYRAVVTANLPRQAAEALAAGLDGVLHFSRRSAEAYVNAARNTGLLAHALGKPVHYCLSGRIAEPLTEAGAVNVRVAARPDEAALIALCC
ncbi:MAG TPA: uroporphyrinogen-III synthase [Xanthobacteraceae bacterium]|nr:uroporphyrinogen-III synthase [Xanthobacteraceae bacterium]